MTFVNLTPEPIRLAGRDFGADWTFAPSGTVATVVTERIPGRPIEVDFPGDYPGIVESCEIPVFEAHRTVVGLPGPIRGLRFLVTPDVAQLVPERQDVWVPDDPHVHEGQCYWRAFVRYRG